jgi:hypothetical protein
VLALPPHALYSGELRWISPVAHNLFVPAVVFLLVPYAAASQPTTYGRLTGAVFGSSPVDLRQGV